MDDQKSDRAVGRDIPGRKIGRQNDSKSIDPEGGPDQEGSVDHFIRNNLWHKVLSPYKILAVIASIPLAGAFFLGFRASNISRTEISKVVNETTLNVQLDREHNIREKFSEIDKHFIQTDIKLNECEALKARVDPMWYAFISPNSTKGKR